MSRRRRKNGQNGQNGQASHPIDQCRDGMLVLANLVGNLIYLGMAKPPNEYTIVKK